MCIMYTYVGYVCMRVCVCMYEWLIISLRLRLAGHLARIEKTRSTYEVLVGTLLANRHFED
jgi:hypothetical protein